MAALLAAAILVGASLQEPFSWTAAVGALGLLVSALAGVAAGKVLRAYRLTIEGEATRRERARIGRDLHDGLAQELAFVSMQAYRLALAHDDDRALKLAEAAGRALDESRQVVSRLRHRPDVPFVLQLEHVVGPLAERGKAKILWDVPSQCEVKPEHQEHLIRIAGEAVNNGVRHGRATRIWLELRENEDGIRLTVSDNGIGFATGLPSGGVGLTSMCERAEVLGGRLSVRSHPGDGTQIEVVIP